MSRIGTCEHFGMLLDCGWWRLANNYMGMKGATGVVFCISTKVEKKCEMPPVHLSTSEPDVKDAFGSLIPFPYTRKQNMLGLPFQTHPVESHRTKMIRLKKSTNPQRNNNLIS
jgi:hypothetical protein